MATIKIDGTKRLMNDVVEVTFDVRTSKGKLLIPISVDDHGNDDATRRAARRDLRIWLQEALRELEAQEI